MNRLTSYELREINDRVGEISKLLELDLDDDICDNLVNELEEFEVILKRSLKATQIAERGLVLV